MNKKLTRELIKKIFKDMPDALCIKIERFADGGTVNNYSKLRDYYSAEYAKAKAEHDDYAASLALSAMASIGMPVAGDLVYTAPQRNVNSPNYNDIYMHDLGSSARTVRGWQEQLEGKNYSIGPTGDIHKPIIEDGASKLILSGHEGAKTYMDEMVQEGNPQYIRDMATGEVKLKRVNPADVPIGFREPKAAAKGYTEHKLLEPMEYLRDSSDEAYLRRMANTTFKDDARAVAKIKDALGEWRPTIEHLPKGIISAIGALGLVPVVTNLKGMIKAGDNARVAKACLEAIEREYKENPNNVIFAHPESLEITPEKYASNNSKAPLGRAENIYKAAPTANHEHKPAVVDDSKESFWKAYNHQYEDGGTVNDYYDSDSYAAHKDNVDKQLDYIRDIDKRSYKKADKALDDLSNSMLIASGATLGNSLNGKVQYERGQALEDAFRTYATTESPKQNMEMSEVARAINDGLLKRDDVKPMLDEINSAIKEAKKTGVMEYGAKGPLIKTALPIAIATAIPSLIASGKLSYKAGKEMAEAIRDRRLAPETIKYFEEHPWLLEDTLSDRAVKTPHEMFVEKKEAGGVINESHWLDEVAGPKGKYGYGFYNTVEKEAKKHKSYKVPEEFTKSLENKSMSELYSDRDKWSEEIARTRKEIDMDWENPPSDLTQKVLHEHFRKLEQLEAEWDAIHNEYCKKYHEEEKRMGIEPIEIPKDPYANN